MIKMFPIYMYPRTGSFESRVLRDITNPQEVNQFTNTEQKNEPLIFPDAFTIDKKELDAIVIPSTTLNSSVTSINETNKNNK